MIVSIFGSKMASDGPHYSQYPRVKLLKTPPSFSLLLLFILSTVVSYTRSSPPPIPRPHLYEYQHPHLEPAAEDIGVPVDENLEPNGRLLTYVHPDHPVPKVTSTLATFKLPVPKHPSPANERPNPAVAAVLDRKSSTNPQPATTVVPNSQQLFTADEIHPPKPLPIPKRNHNNENAIITIAYPTRTCKISLLHTAAAQDQALLAARETKPWPPSATDWNTSHWKSYKHSPIFPVISGLSLGVAGSIIAWIVGYVLFKIIKALKERVGEVWEGMRSRLRHSNGSDGQENGIEEEAVEMQAWNGEEGEDGEVWEASGRDVEAGRGEV